MPRGAAVLPPALAPAPNRVAPPAWHALRFLPDVSQHVADSGARLVGRGIATRVAALSRVVSNIRTWARAPAFMLKPCSPCIGRRAVGMGDP